MQVKFFKATEVAEEVGKANNNAALEAQLKLFLTAVELQGFKFCKEVKDG